MSSGQPWQSGHLPLLLERKFGTWPQRPSKSKGHRDKSLLDSVMPPLTLFFRFPSEAFFFQLFHNSGGSGVADAQATLQERGGDVFVFFG